MSLPPARPPLQSVGSHGPPTLPRRGPWGPLLLPSRGPRAPYFYPVGAHGAPHNCVPCQKKIFAGFAGENFFPLHSRFFDGSIYYRKIRIIFLGKSVNFNISSSYSSYEDDIKTSRIPIPFSII